MRTKLLLAAFAFGAVCTVRAASYSMPLTGLFQLGADRIAGAAGSEQLVASGHVVAVSHPWRLLTDYVEKTNKTTVIFHDPTAFTSCTNEMHALHWHVNGEIEYHEGEYAILRNVWLKSYNIPLFWIPYWYHPLDGECGLRMMPGYTGRWGAFLLSKYVYHIAGDKTYAEGSWYLHGNTRFDLRWENGVALGETLYWQLGDYGRGKFKVYYAWDRSDRYESNWSSADYNYQNWGSTVPQNRWFVELSHSWDITERDILRLQGGLMSDSYVPEDYIRPLTLSIANDFRGANDNEIAWEHNELLWGTGLSVGGPLCDFYSGTSRLPEWYLDFNPMPVFSTPIIYESQTKLGYLKRDAAHFGDASTTSYYSWTPGVWAEYDTFRLDTYHRLTAPFKVADILSVVPRVAYHGTYWNNSGITSLDGKSTAGETGDHPFRSIFEAGVTFAGRGSAWINDDWRHTLEPYLDFLGQKACYAGLGDGSRPYVFDSIDASSDWEDQFAGRSRNLPYTYLGITPGLRNAWQKTDEKGNLRTILDVDVYAALQFNKGSWLGDDEYHKLAEPGEPNYGTRSCMAVPGVRMRWYPFDSAMFAGKFEYDTENNRVALAQATWRQKVSQRFSYGAIFSCRNHRYWDFSSAPYNSEYMLNEDFNMAHFSRFTLHLTHDVCDPFAWGPYLRWDCKEGEFDEIGTWVDLRTDCLGFRFTVYYRNRYERIDGSEYERDYGVGFYIYLRAFGSDSGSILGD